MDRKAFQEQVLPLKNRLYRQALHLLPGAQEAEDAVQDVLIKLWNRRSELAGIENLEAWTYRIMRNACLDRLRTRKHRIVALSDAATLASSESGPAAQTEWRDAFDHVSAIMGRLPEAQRSVLHLREIEEMSYQEIADQTGQSMDSVKVNLFRARRSVRDQYTQQLAYGS
jgi:RNA polymerase sigma-70 factor (ECF subfamily)